MELWHLMAKETTEMALFNPFNAIFKEMDLRTDK